MNTADIPQLVADLSDAKVYPIGQKIYRVLDDGRIMMEKVTGYEIVIDAKYRTKVRHTGEGRYSKFVTTPDEGQYASRVKSWHLDRKSAVKAAKPLIRKDAEKTIAQLNGQRQEIDVRIADLRRELGLEGETK